MILIFYNLKKKNSETNPIFLKANASAHKTIHFSTATYEQCKNHELNLLQAKNDQTRKCKFLQAK